MKIKFERSLFSKKVFPRLCGSHEYSNEYWLVPCTATDLVAYFDDVTYIATIVEDYFDDITHTATDFVAYFDDITYTAT